MEKEIYNLVNTLLNNDEEIYDNSLEKYYDLIAAGLSKEEAYEKVKSDLINLSKRENININEQTKIKKKQVKKNVSVK